MMTKKQKEYFKKRMKYNANKNIVIFCMQVIMLFIAFFVFYTPSVNPIEQKLYLLGCIIGAGIGVVCIAILESIFQTLTLKEEKETHKLLLKRRLELICQDIEKAHRRGISIELEAFCLWQLYECHKIFLVAVSVWAIFAYIRGTNRLITSDLAD